MLDKLINMHDVFDGRYTNLLNWVIWRVTGSVTLGSYSRACGTIGSFAVYFSGLLLDNGSTYNTIEH